MAHVIITGGTSGIGAALAHACARRGDSVSLIARSEAALMAMKATLLAQARGEERHIYTASADVGDAAAVEEAIRTCEAALGPCDTMITSAGIVAPGLFETQPADVFEQQIRINFLGSVRAIRAVYAGMKTRRKGQILMIGSGAGLIGIYGYTAYCASKYAIAGFAEALRAEARPHGITVSVCFPPDTETPQLRGELPLRPAEAHATIGNGRIWSAEDVARAALAGVAGNRFAIFPGMQMKLLGTFGSIAMPFLRPWFDRRIALSRRGATPD